jgi:hypothetical protein
MGGMPSGMGGMPGGMGGMPGGIFGGMGRVGFHINKSCHLLLTAFLPHTLSHFLPYKLV